jgi:hypothetical protein
MAMVIIIESDPSHIEPVTLALQAVDAKIILKNFNTSVDFEKWLTQTDVHTEISCPDKVRLIICTEKYSSHGSSPQISQFDAWTKKISASCKHAQLKFIVGFFATDEKEFKAWTLTQSVFNLVQKPYDDLILKQNLRLALGVDSSQGSDLHSMKTTSIIEVLKPAKMFAVSEVGFITKSDRELPIGKVTKYYSAIFSWQTVYSVFARSLDQFQDPKTKDWFLRLTWFGTGRNQLLHVRARFPKIKVLPLPWSKPQSVASVQILVIGDPSPAGAELSGTLARLFKNTKVTSLKDYPEATVTLPEQIAIVLVHINLLSLAMADPRIKDIPRVVLFETDLKDQDFRAHAEAAIDIISLPVERLSFAKKMSVLFPQLTIAEDNEIKTFLWSEEISVGQPIELVEMSELGLIQKYERAFPVGTIRQFVLWQPMEVGLPILTARCYQSQNSDTPSVFLNHFIFFGMTDHHIKEVRLWMRDHYIQAKQKG